MPKQIGYVIGSLRKDSWNRKLANALIRLGPPDFNFKELRIGDLPLYDQDDDRSQAPEVQRLKSFYAAALEPLGYRVLLEFVAEQNIGYIGVGMGGADGKPDFWIGTATGSPTEPSGRMHLAFVAQDRATVDAFHRAALAAGATDNGAPGPRPHYHAGYYGAFVVDPAGNNLEAVCHRPA